LVEQNKGRRADAPILSGQLFSSAIPHVFAHDPKTFAVPLLEPIHDGFHLLTDLSIVCKKVQHAGAFSLAARTRVDLEYLAAADK
jgi:hypothetical protein